MRGKLRRTARLLAIGALAVLMSGCMKLQMDLKVSSSDTVSGSIIFAVNKDLLAAVQQSFDDITQGESPLPSDVADVQVADYEDDTFIGKTYTFSDVPLDKFNTPDDPESLNIVHANGTFTVSGTMDLSQGFDPSQPMMQQFADSAQISVSMTFPGKVQSSNGQIDGNKVTWTPKMGETLQLTAVAGDTSSGGGMLLWILLAIVAVVVVVVVVVLLSRKGKGAPAPAADSGFEGTAGETGMPAVAAPPEVPAATEAMPSPAMPPAMPPSAPPEAPPEPPAAPSDGGDTTA